MPSQTNYEVYELQLNTNSLFDEGKENTKISILRVKLPGWITWNAVQHDEMP